MQKKYSVLCFREDGNWFARAGCSKVYRKVSSYPQCIVSSENGLLSKRRADLGHGFTLVEFCSYNFILEVLSTDYPRIMSSQVICK